MARNYDEFLADLAKKQEADKAAAAAQGQPQVTAPTVAPVAPAQVPKAKAGIPAFLLPPEPKPAAAQKKSAAPSAPKVTTKVETRKAKLPAMSQVSSEVKSGAPNAQPGAAPQPPVQREIALPPDVAKPVDWKKFYDYAGKPEVGTAVRNASSIMGVSADELKRLAQAQGVDLESINSAKLKGRTYDEIARAARERGVLGFLPEDERLTVFRRSVEDIEKAARGEASDRQIELVKSGADQGLSGGGALAGGLTGVAGGPVGAAVGAAAGSVLGSGGYLAAGTSTELPEVSKPGEYGYLGATLLVEALQKDPTASRIYDLYGRGLATGNTQKYVEDRVADLLKRTGFAPGSAQAEEVLPKLRRRAINEVLAYKTIGQWTPAITMQDVQVTEGAAAPGFFAALGPNVELVGINNKNQAVYRQESPLGVLFRVIDIPQEALVAKLEGREAAEGIQAGSNLFEYAIEHTKDESPYVRYPAMAAGFLASVVTPDLLLAGGVVQKGAKAAKRAMDIRKNGAKAIQLLETVADARQAKDYVRATTAERELRELSPGIADQLDRYDANAAGLIEMVDPNTDILNEDMAALIGAQIPSQKEFAAQRLFLHPSVRKPELSGNLPKKSVPVVTYSGLFDTDDLLKRAAEAKKSYVDNAPATIDDYASMYARGTARDVLSDAVDKGALTPVQADEISDIVAKHAPVSLTDEQRFADLVRQEMKAHPEYGQSKYNIIRQVVYTPGKNKLRGRLDRKMTDIKGKTVAQIQAPDIALFDRAIAAIEKNNEARGTGAALLRDEIAKEAKLRVQPLNLFDDVALKTPEGEPIRLSPGGVLWLKQVRTAMPNQDFKEAYGVATTIDAMITGQAKKRGVDAFDLYREILPSIRKATDDEILRITGRAPGAPTAPAAPTTPVAARATAAAAAAPTPAAAGAAAAVGPALVTSPTSTPAVTTFTQSAAAAAAAKVAPLNLSPHGMRAASFVAELPAGMVERDLTDVAVATQILRDIQSNLAGSGYGLAEAKLQTGIFSDARDGSIARAISAGDVRVVVDQPKVNDPFVIAVVVGDKVTRIQAPAPAPAAAALAAAPTPTLTPAPTPIPATDLVDTWRSTTAAEVVTVGGLARSFEAAPGVGSVKVLPESSIVVVGRGGRHYGFPSQKDFELVEADFDSTLAPVRFSEVRGVVRPAEYSADGKLIRRGLVDIDGIPWKAGEGPAPEPVRAPEAPKAPAALTPTPAAPAPALTPAAAMRRGIDEAEKMMEARVKAGQPAMRGAPVEDVEVTTRLPPPSQPAATAPKTADLFERLFGSEQAMARRAEEAAETEPTVFEPTVSDVTAEIPRRRIRAELVRGEQAIQRRLAEGEEAFQRKLQRASETLAALEPTERVRPSVAAEEVLEPTAKVEAPRAAAAEEAAAEPVFQRVEAPAAAAPVAEAAPAAAKAEAPVFTEVFTGSKRDMAAERLAASSDVAASYPPWVVAEVGGEVVGAAYVGSGGGSYRFDIIVAPKAQGTGIGARLLDQVIADYLDAEAKLPGLTISAEVVSPLMKQMLERRGFKERAPFVDRYGLDFPVATSPEGFRTTFMEATSADLARPAVAPRVMDERAALPDVPVADADLLRRADDLSRRAQEESSRALDTLARELLPPGLPAGDARLIVSRMVDPKVHPAFEAARRLEDEAVALRQQAQEAVSAAPAQPSGITPAAVAPVVAEKISPDLEKFLAAVKKLKTPKATEKFLGDLQAAALAPAEKVQVYDSLATKLENLAEAEGGDDVLETLASTARTAELRSRQEAETALRQGTTGLKQVGPAGQIKGVTELMADGRSVILLFEQADASTVLHEVAHIVRRNVLDQDDMDAITKWIVSRGVKVGHQYGEFTGSANDVEQAEELFAKAFEEYVRQGVAPNSRVQAAFDALKTVIANIYRGVSDPVIGANLQPEVRQVFDKLLADVPEQANPTIKQVLRQQILGTNAREQSGFLDVLAKEATRKGLPRSSLEEVTKQFDFGEGREFARRMIEKRIAEQGETPTQAAEAIRKAFGPSASAPAAKMTDRERGIMAAVGRPSATPDPIRISFPVPVLGKRDWTIDDLAELQASREVEAAVAAKRKQGILLDLAGGAKTAAAVPEEDAVESLRSAIAYSDDDSKLTAKSKQIARGVAATFFGGDVVGENGMRQLPPELRNAINTTVAVVEQSIGDVVSLTNDALVSESSQNLYRYLAGEGDIRRLAGRPIVSAGHDYMGSVRQMFQRAIASLSPEEQAALTKLCDALNLPAGSQRNKALETLGFDATGATFKLADAARQQTQDEAVSAVNKLLYLKGKEKETDFGSSLATAMRNAVEAPPTPRPTHEMRLVEAMSYIAGNTSRDGALFKGDSKEAAKLFLTDVGAIYKSEESARRVAVLIGGYGSAALGKNILVKLNLGISPDAYKAFTRWLAGENWDPRYTEEIQRVVDRYGYNPEFVADQVLASDMYIPRIARERMGEALARSVYRPSASVTGGDAVNVAYRYMKTRMTRGSFFLRQRYFMMNTVDHFIQMSITAGFGTAAMSVTRVLAQDLMVVPGWQQAVELLRKAPVVGGAIPADVLERVRRVLQKGGDRAANHVGTLFGAAKYRIEVNPILEGVDGGFTVGGKVYRYRDIRDIAVQERVFASYDTRQLANAIEREGSLFFSPTLTGAGGTLTTSTGKSRIKDFLADWQTVVSDTAEAWGERERLGAMVSFMEAGYDPRTAARLATQALYDYSQSMTKADRSMLVGILFPFWAFQKNANAQIFNTIFSPWGAYRMMCIKRARERGMEALTEILYNDVGGEYEIDVESMPPELQDSYYSVITRFEESYPNGDPPPEAKRAMRMLLAGRARMVEEGKLVELAANLQIKRDQGAFADLQRFSAYAVARPSKSQRPTYMRDRAGATIPFPRTEAMRMYYSMVGDDHSYMELFIPESSIEAGFKHLTQVSAAYMLMGAAPVDFLLGGSLKQGGMDEVTLQRVLGPIADPTRSPLLAPLIAGSLSDAVPPRKVSMGMAAGAEVVKEVHPFVGKLMDDAFGTTFLRVPQIADPFVIDPSKGETMGLPPEEAERIRALQKQYPDASVIRDQRYYIPGGAWATAFDNSPFGELNAMLLRYEANPMERNDIRGEILSWARGSMGIDVELVSPKAVIQREEPEKLKSTREM